MSRNKRQYRSYVIIGAISVCVLWGISDLNAQTDIKGLDPGAVQERATKIYDYYLKNQELIRGRRPEDKPLVEPLTHPREVRPEIQEETVFVRRILTDPSEILSQNEIEDITEPFEGTQVNIDDLFKIVAKINQVYKSRKYLTARAFLPAQKIKDGVVHIRLIEGRVGDILVEGAKYTRPSFFIKRISLKSGDIVDLNQLEKDLSFFNSINDVQMKAELRAGKEPGTTDCILKVFEPKRISVSAFTDNAGRDDIGLYRIGAMASVNSVFGFRDRLSLGTYWAEGTASGSFLYDFPIFHKGTRLGVTYDINQIDIISGDFEILNIEGDSSDLSAYVTHPFIGKADFVLNGFFEYHLKDTETSFDGVTLLETEVNNYSIGFDTRHYDDKGMLYSRHNFTVGSDDSLNSKDYFKYNMDISRLHILSKNVMAILRGSAQISSEDLLPSSEQFQIGGLSTVRGYSEGLLIGDNGYLVSAELNFPILKKEHRWYDKVKGSVFIDHGGAFPFKPDGESIDEDDFLTGAGVGLILNLSKHLSGTINIGIPLMDQDAADDDVKVHFYFQSTF